MPIQLVPPTPAHAPEIARILFDAFGGVAATHAHPSDFPHRDLATMVAGLLLNRPDFIGIVAEDSDSKKVLGSNFVMLADSVAGVGPLTVNPACQSRGLGKLMMQWAIDTSRAKGFPNIRLVQEAFNRTSISLYASLGYATQEPIAELLTAPGAPPDPTVRPATPADIPELDALYQRHTGLSRKNELTLSLQGGFPVMLRQTSSRITGYLMGSIFGHGIADSNDDALALAGQLANLTPEGNHFILPLRNADLFQKALAQHMRVQKIMNLMTIGKYQPPTGTWLPSVTY